MAGMGDVVTGFFSFAAGLAFTIFIRSKITSLRHILKSSVFDNKHKPAPADVQLAVVIRTDIKMGLGKAVAQSCHAGLGTYCDSLNTDPQIVENWKNANCPIIVAQLPTGGQRSLYELAQIARNHGISAEVIHDAGRTQIAAGTATAVGIGPAPKNIIDKICGHLQLV